VNFHIDFRARLCCECLLFGWSGFYMYHLTGISQISPLKMQSHRFHRDLQYLRKRAVIADPRSSILQVPSVGRFGRIVRLTCLQATTLRNDFTQPCKHPHLFL
jgi:hypothetical protein